MECASLPPPSIDVYHQQQSLQFTQFYPKQTETPFLSPLCLLSMKHSPLLLEYVPQAFAFLGQKLMRTSFFIIHLIIHDAVAQTLLPYFRLIFHLPSFIIVVLFEGKSKLFLFFISTFCGMLDPLLLLRNFSLFESYLFLSIISQSFHLEYSLYFTAQMKFSIQGCDVLSLSCQDLYQDYVSLPKKGNKLMVFQKHRQLYQDFNFTWQSICFLVFIVWQKWKHIVNFTAGIFIVFFYVCAPCLPLQLIDPKIVLYLVLHISLRLLNVCFKQEQAYHINLLHDFDRHQEDS